MRAERVSVGYTGAMKRLSLVLLFPALVACTGKGGDSNTDSTTDSHDGTDDTAHPDDVSPTIVSVDTVNCAEYQSAGESWDLALTVDDPQGATTVSDGTVSVLSSAGGELASYVLACGNGQCFGSFRAEYDGIGCSSQGDVTLRFIVTDAEGHASAAVDYVTTAP